jgi:ribosomal protein S18 acetylase RimI-like enzyme
MVATSTHKECVNLHQIFILPAHQGLGIGTACMGQIIQEAENAQLPIQLRVQKVNPRAYSFFQKFGFKQAGETETHFLLERPVPLG